MIDSNSHSGKDFHYDMRTESDKACWSTVVSTSVLVFMLVAMLIYNQWGLTWSDSIRLYSFEYFLVCMLGGAMSGALPHTLVTPMDVIKCRVQVGEYASFADGFHHIHVTESRGIWSLSIPQFFRGWAPTFIGYGMQGSLKFGLYEVFKFFFSSTVFSHEFAAAHKVTVFLLASCCAELVADLALAPWEAVKVKMQTTRTYPPKLNIVVPRMFAAEGWSGFYKGLTPLWGRQVPYTMMKFASFEKIVEVLYFVFTPGSAKAAQIGLSLLAGFISGMLCALVSHPADTLVSKLNQKTDGRITACTLLSSLSCRELWKGVVVRVIMMGALTAVQWVIYDSFKVTVGLPTTGGGAGGQNHHAPALAPLPTSLPLIE